MHGAVNHTMAQVSLAAYDPIFWCHHAFVDLQWWIWQTRHPDAVYSDEARGPLTDSKGTFLGRDVIRDVSGWEYGIVVQRLPRHALGSSCSEPQLFLILHEVQSMNAPTAITVYIDDVEIASEPRLGMQGMMPIAKDVFVYVEPEQARAIWIDQGLGPDEIPKSATVWVTINGAKIQRLDQVVISVKWLTV